MYFHLSTKYHGKKVLFEPRVPISASEGENKIIPRVCFTPSLEQCLMAIEGYDDWRTIFFTHHNQKYFVYTIHGNSKIFTPDNNMVCDAYRTKEVWRLIPTMLYYRGKVIIDDGELRVTK